MKAAIPPTIEKYKESPGGLFLKEYAKINEKMYRRYYRVRDSSFSEELSGKDMTFIEYDEWSQKAQKTCKDYIAVRDVVSKNSRLSSKQKYSKKQSLGEKFIADVKAIPCPDKPGKRKSRGDCYGVKIQVKISPKIFIKI